MINDFVPSGRSKSPKEVSNKKRSISIRSDDAPAEDAISVEKPTKAIEAASSGPSPQLTHAQPFLRPGQPGMVDATDDSLQDDDVPKTLDLDDNSADKKSGNGAKKLSPWRRLKGWWQGLSKKKKIAYSAIALAVLLAAGAALYFFVIKSQPVAYHYTAKKTVKKVAKPVITYSNLTGLAVDPTVNQRPVIGVMIENSMDARPQSGLNDAGVVFEAIAEGGITRFLTLFQDTEPDYIGPVRSVRPYYIQWGAAFNAAIAHVGGSPEALQDMKDWGVRDLDQFAGSSYFTRITARYAPHNVYTSIANLRKYAESKGYTTATYTGFSRNKTETKPSTTTPPKAKSVNIAISGATFNVHYDYDAPTNSYLRSEGGAPHLDERSKKQLAPKVVVALVMPYSLQSDRIHSVYETLGSGKAYVFQTGNVSEVTWHKADRNAQFTFTDAAGKDFKLEPGQTWLTAVGAASAVTYAP